MILVFDLIYFQCITVIVILPLEKSHWDNTVVKSKVQKYMLLICYLIYFQCKHLISHMKRGADIHCQW